MAQNDDDAAQAANWKRKYYDALGDNESKERQWSQAEDLLRKTISRLTLAADGLDERLDRHLKDLRDAIRDRADAKLLRQRIEAMSESLVRLDAKRTKKTAAPNPAEPLQALMDKLEWPRGHARRVKALRKRLDAVADDNLAPIITELANLLQDMFNTAQTQAGETGKSGGGLLSRLFGGEGKADPQAAAPAESEPPSDKASSNVDQAVRDLGTARALLLQVLDGFLDKQPDSIGALRQQALRATSEAELKRLAGALAAEFEMSPTVIDRPEDRNDSARDPACGSQLLLQLLQRLDLPSDLDADVEALKDQLEDRSNFDAQKVLSSMATLIADMRARLQEEKHEIEDFLKQLTGQLQDIDSIVRGTESARSEAYSSGRELGDAVQAQVRGLEDSVATAQNLDMLKRSVQQRLNAIMDHVEQHRVKEELRNTQMETQVRDLTERIRDMESESGKLHERIHEQRNQAMTDALTGIPNRLAYQERIAQEFARWKRFHTPLALLVWDVDHFKAVNDEYGHKAGDKVLKVIAETLHSQIRETDFLSRYGGEEFVLIMTGTVQPAIMEVANKLREAIETCGFHFRGESVSITISCGIAEFREGDSIDEVFERADAALYRAKDAGRNQCVVAGAD